MDILPVNTVMQVLSTNRHEDQHPQKRQQPRKKDNTRSRSVYTPDGHIEEEPPRKLDVVG
jgi:hypothetical protein